MRLPKDPFPALSHWVGAVLSLTGMAVLLNRSTGRPWWEVAAFSVYGVTLVLLYVASALAHSLSCSPENAARLDRFDYAAIFVVIAGTYTPVCVVGLRGPWGWALLAAVWATAAFGVMAVFGKSPSRLGRVITYIVMGWLGVVVAVPLLRVLSAGTIAWLLAGGVVYTVGAAVYFTNRPHLWPGRFAAHDLWHCMVIAGSACHFVAIAGFATSRSVAT